MKYNKTEEQGRFALRTLLGVAFLACFASAGYQRVPLTAEALPGLLLSLLPTLVVLWAILRGSFPALVILVIGLWSDIDAVVSALQYGGTDALTSPRVLLSFLVMLAKLVTVGAIFQQGQVGAYLTTRKLRRTWKDHLLEGGLWAAALIAGWVYPLLPFFQRLSPT